MRNVLQEIGAAESISGGRFVTGSRINALTAHAQILRSQKSPKTEFRVGNDYVFIANSVRRIQNVTSSFKPKVEISSKLCMCRQKLPK